jgi:multidrug efflux system membrane fusion protein
LERHLICRANTHLSRRLGIVQAYNSVLMNARVLGQIQEICFREGQDIHQGEVLAVTDPRVYQAQYN